MSEMPLDMGELVTREQALNEALQRMHDLFRRELWLYPGAGYVTNALMDAVAGVVRK